MTSIQVNVKGINVTLTYEQAITLNAELESKIYATPEHKNEHEGMRNKISAIVIGHDLPAAQEILRVLKPDFATAHTILDYPLFSEPLAEKMLIDKTGKFDWDKLLQPTYENPPRLEKHDNGRIPWNPRPSKKKR